MEKLNDRARAIAALTKEQYRVTQDSWTEPPGTGEYVHNDEPGIYVSASLRFVHRDEMEAEGYGAYLDQLEDRT